MSLSLSLDAGRRFAESRMLSTATIRRKTGTTTTAPNGLKVPVWDTIYTDLPVRVAGTSGSTAPYRTLSIAGGQVEIAARVLHFPASTTGLRDGDYAEIAAGDTTGAVFQILEADWQDQATARRVPAVAATRPTEWA